MLFMRRVVVCLCLFFPVFIFFEASADITPEYKMDAQEKERITHRLDSFWERNCEPSPKTGTSIMDFSSFALDGASVGYRSDRIEFALEVLLKNVYRADQKSNKFGNMFWYYGDTAVKDMNGVEFCTRRDVLIWMLYKDALSEKSQRLCKELLTLSAEGIKRHQVKITYTNIILMKIWNLIAIGENCERTDLAVEGYRLLDEWLAYTAENGIYEFLSPTYYAVDFENLSLIAHLSKREYIRKKAVRALDYLWTDVALNWYAPSSRLGGTHSRDYDRLTGHGDLDNLVRRAGWMPNRQKPEKGDVYSYYAFYPPPKSAEIFLKSPFPRFVFQRWGSDEQSRSSHYLAKKFSIASAQSNYFNMDKTPLVIQLGEGDDTPVINYFMDGRSDYYGKNKIMEGSGHMKSLHLKPFTASVQHMNEVIFIAQSKDDKDVSEKCESIITLPADAEYWLNNEPLNIFAKRSAWEYYPSPNNTTTKIRITGTESAPVLEISDKDSTEGVGVQQRIDAVPAAQYTLRARVKGGSVSLYLNFYDKSGARIEPEHSVQMKSHKDFEWQEITETAPAQTASLAAWIYSPRGSKTECTVDAITVDETSGEKSKNIARFDFVPIKYQTFSMKENDTLFVKRNDAVASLRPLWITDGQNMHSPIVIDNDGLNFGSFRLTAAHSSSSAGKSGFAAFYCTADEGIASPKIFDTYRKRILALKISVASEEDQFSIAANGLTGLMTLAADLKNRKILQRQGMNKGTENHVLSVNGKEIGRNILVP
jgi:hypothetical protein